ncbi:tRNA threonylcarbamoyladenosine biosynthesis protein RimN [Blochmannia endosymbiont of Polyrhachis (Hedomyrma) turneri]|nr:tRNA threonylcarbamoyladenosine biosynthesis protein RimN [Blochmannia endosymbiont of Polyrhachis (Hedomyrma) turneri]
MDNHDLSFALHCSQVIIYPTESVFGLGCDPDSEFAVKKLLDIKQRSWKKGLILVAAYYKQLINYIDDSSLNNVQRSRVFSTWPGHISWSFPVHSNTPKWLIGDFSSLVVRLSSFKPIQELCLSFGKPLVSTSANISGYLPADNVDDVCDQLGLNLFIMDGSVGDMQHPSEIRSAVTGKLIRK